MPEIRELPNEIIEEWVSTYLSFRINKNKPIPDPVLIIEGMLFYARDALLDEGLNRNDYELVNQAKAINSLANVLRGEPPTNYWNGCLRKRGLPINQLIFP